MPLCPQQWAAGWGPRSFPSHRPHRPHESCLPSSASNVRLLTCPWVKGHPCPEWPIPEPPVQGGGGGPDLARGTGRGLGWHGPNGLGLPPGPDITCERRTELLVPGQIPPGAQGPACPHSPRCGSGPSRNSGCCPACLPALSSTLFLLCILGSLPPLPFFRRWPGSPGTMVGGWGGCPAEPQQLVLDPGLHSSSWRKWGGGRTLRAKCRQAGVLSSCPVPPVPPGGGTGLPTGVWRLRATPLDRGLCQLHRSLRGFGAGQGCV